MLLSLPLLGQAAEPALSCPLPSLPDSGPASPRLKHQALDSEAARTLFASVTQATPAPQDNYGLASAFLQRLGSQVQRHADDSAKVPAGGAGVLFWLTGNPPLDDTRAQALLDWVAAGHRLVAVADDSTQLLAATLGVRAMPTRDLELPITPLMTQPPWPRLTQLYLAEDDAPAYLGFDDSHHLFDVGDQAAAWASSSAATHLLLFEWGTGSVVLLSDTDLWRNGELGHYDNAWLLWYLTQGAPVTLIAPLPPAPAWRVVLAHYGAPAVLAALWLAVCYWRRTGNRRHVEWPTLVAELQQDIQRRLQRRQPATAGLGVAERWQRLALLSGLPTRQVGEAMQPLPSGASASLFTRRIRQLQQLRQSLAGTPRKEFP